MTWGQMTSYGELKTMNRNVLPMPHLCLYLQKDFQLDVGHSSDLDQEQSGICRPTSRERPQGEWDRVAELMMIKFRESGHPVFRATSPFSRRTLKSKGGGAQSFLSISSVSTEQSQMCVRNTVLVKQER